MSVVYKTCKHTLPWEPSPAAPYISLAGTSPHVPYRSRDAGNQIAGVSNTECISCHNNGHQLPHTQWLQYAWRQALGSWHWVSQRWHTEAPSIHQETLLIHISLFPLSLLLRPLICEDPLRPQFRNNRIIYILPRAKRSSPLLRQYIHKRKPLFFNDTKNPVYKTIGSL